jgi:hypothetical protein
LRTVIDKGEELTIPVIVTEKEAAGKPVLKYRNIGAKTFKTAELQHINRCVYKATIPANKIKGDFEYYIEYASKSGETLYFPATAPELNQSVVVW